MKVSELEGIKLALWVAKASGAFGRNVEWWQMYNPDERVLRDSGSDYPDDIYRPDLEWKQGGPIIEREEIGIERGATEWSANKTAANNAWSSENGPTPLIAAMRCYVASKFGEEVE